MSALNKKLKTKKIHIMPKKKKKRKMSPCLFLLFLGNQTEQPRKTKINPKNS